MAITPFNRANHAANTACLATAAAIAFVGRADYEIEQVRSDTGYKLASSSFRVYSCFGAEYTASAVPISTIRPACITAMRSQR